ncbi:Receptor-like proteiny region, transmembrane domain- and RING domain-containing protein 1 [Yarrowia sp. C11]|nr:Receptor-like proteiny region, transmembrane domain- and RING domain-containing protein 1 [Yarrowia sp. E02]KAG5369244.1 Receptor-like proteiny region, transmembrane domain- and RING domain-containing protein 1 [Yarrowia sp. C11]
MFSLTDHKFRERVEDNVRARSALLRNSCASCSYQSVDRRAYGWRSTSSKTRLVSRDNLRNISYSRLIGGMALFVSLSFAINYVLLMCFAASPVPGGLTGHFGLTPMVPGTAPPGGAPILTNTALIISPNSDFVVPARMAAFGRGLMMDHFDTNTMNEEEKKVRAAVEADAQEAQKLANDIAEYFPTGISDGTPILIPPNRRKEPTVNAPLRGAIEVVSGDACGTGRHRNLTDKIALVMRGGCSFYDKVLTIQGWDAKAVIVGDNQYNRGLVTMYSTNDTDMCRVPAMFVSRASFELLSTEDEVSIIPGPSATPALDTILFLLISPICSLSIIYLMVSVHRYFTQLTRRAPKRAVKQLPVRVWMGQGVPSPTVKGRAQGTGSSGVLESVEPNSAAAAQDECPEPSTHSDKVWVSSDECIICLEEFTVGESRVMQLPCGHDFHEDCIQRWLTTQQRTCPICKHDITQPMGSPNETTPLV